MAQLDLLNISQVAVNEVLEMFLKEAKDNPELYIAEEVQLVQLNSRIKRILWIKNNNVNDAYESLVNTMKWRKMIDMNSLDESDIPRQLFQIGCIFPYGKDKNGSKLLIFRVNMHKQFTQWSYILKRYILYLIECEDKLLISNESKGLTIVFDCQRVELENVNLLLLEFIIAKICNYYTGLLNSILVYKMPVRFNWTFNGLQSFLPIQLTNIAYLVNNYEQLLDHVDMEELPDFMGGSNQLPYRTSPPNAPTFQEYAQRFNLNADEYIEHLEQYLI